MALSGNEISTIAKLSGRCLHCKPLQINVIYSIDAHDLVNRMNFIDFKVKFRTPVVYVASLTLTAILHLGLDNKLGSRFFFKASFFLTTDMKINQIIPSSSSDLGHLHCLIIYVSFYYVGWSACLFFTFRNKYFNRQRYTTFPRRSRFDLQWQKSSDNYNETRSV